MFVIVFLSGPKQLTVIPEEFIFDLDERKLKNLGCNRNQSQRIYFSKEWFQNQIDGINLEKKFTPNFNLPASSIYPMPNDVEEAVYIANLRKFESKAIIFFLRRMILFNRFFYKFYLDTFEDAMIFVRLFRPVTPAVYNPARLSEQPIPRAELTIDANNQNEPSSPSTANVDLNHGASLVTEQHEQDDLESTWYNSRASNHSDATDDSAQLEIKHIVHVSEDDLVAFENLFNENEAQRDEDDPLASNNENEHGNSDTNPSAINSRSFGNGISSESTRHNATVVESAGRNDDSLQDEPSNANESHHNNLDEAERIRQINNNVAMILLHGQKVVLCDGLEYLHIPGQELKAMEYVPKYEVKTNDLLCGNKPFKRHVIP